MELPLKKPVFTKTTDKPATPPPIVTTATPLPKTTTPNKTETSLSKNDSITPNANIKVVKSNILPLKVNSKGILPGSLLSKDEKKDFAAKKAKENKRTCLFKKIATILIVVALFSIFLIKVNISEDNSFLSKFGIDKNVGQTAIELEEINMQLEIQSLKLDNNINNFEEKIKNKYYTLFAEDIKNIRKAQITWFDKINEQGETDIGIIDGVRRIADYFNSNNYHDINHIIAGRHEKIEVNDIKANRNSVSFSINTTQILGRIIFMNIEVIDVLNSFPIYKNGKQLSSFSRDKNENDDYHSEFSMNLDVQLPGEEDPSDIKFIEYLDWLNSNHPDIKITDYNINNNQ